MLPVRVTNLPPKGFIRQRIESMQRQLAIDTLAQCDCADTRKRLCALHEAAERVEAEARKIANATLPEAATEAHALLVEIGMGEHIAARMLSAALERQA